jgi:MFS family permease
VPVFLDEPSADRRNATTSASVLAFGIIAAGGVSCVAADAVADKHGRTATTSALMALSGGSAITAVFLTDAPLWLLAPVLFPWGTSIVAESAQFSAGVAEVSPPEYIGPARTIQTSMGFLLTLGSKQLVPIGVVATLWMRRLPELLAIANGNRLTLCHSDTLQRPRRISHQAQALSGAEEPTLPAAPKPATPER